MKKKLPTSIIRRSKHLCIVSKIFGILGSQKLCHLVEEVGFGKPRAGISHPPASDNNPIIFYPKSKVKLYFGKIYPFDVDDIVSGGGLMAVV